MSNSFYHTRYCLIKTQREIIEPLLPAPKSTGRPALNSLTAFNAILWILSSGAAWRDLPPQFGNWNSIYHKFRQWCADDVFENILQVLVANTEKYLLVEIDLSKIKLEGKTVLGDKAFCSACIREFMAVLSRLCK